MNNYDYFWIGNLLNIVCGVSNDEYCEILMKDGFDIKQRHEQK